MDYKLSDLPARTSLTVDDLLYVVGIDAETDSYKSTVASLFAIYGIDKNDDNLDLNIPTAGFCNVQLAGGGSEFRVYYGSGNNIFRVTPTALVMDGHIEALNGNALILEDTVTSDRYAITVVSGTLTATAL